MGVVVFDAEGNRAASFNREARRIAESLRTPGRPPEQVLEVLSFRRADGSEVNLREFSIDRLLQSGETLRAEEVVLSVPDGRSVRTLVNATPIRTEDGAVGSLVITVQDLAPLDEVERLRTEFLGLVGHELREPLAAIKGSVTTLLQDRRSLDPAEMREFFRIIDAQTDHMRGLIADLLDAGRIDTGTLSVAPEPAEVSELVEQARSTFVGSGGRHGIAIDLPAGLPPALADRRRIVQVLVNLFANAARYAPESSPIRVAGGARGRRGLGLGRRRRPGGGGGAPGAPLRQACRGGRGRRTGGPRAGACHLQGAGGGAWRAHPGREPGPRARHHGHLHAAGRGGAGRTLNPGPARRRRTGKARRRRPSLVVDDDPRMLRFVRDALSRAGYAPLVTGEAHELDDIIRAERPRLVLLDLLLPGHDGMALMQGDPRALRPAGHLHLRLRPRRDRGEGAGIGRGRLPGQAVLADRAGGPRAARRSGATSGPSRSCSETSPSTTPAAGSRSAARRSSSPPPSTSCCACSRSMPDGSFPSRRCSTGCGRGAKTRARTGVRICVRNLRRKLADDAANPDYIFSERGVGYRMPEPGER